MKAGKLLRVISQLSILVVVGTLSGGTVPMVAATESPDQLDVANSSLTPLSQTRATASFPNCRFGVAGWNKQWEDFNVISNFGVGWYLDFFSKLTTPVQMVGAKYAQVIRVSQSRPDDPTDPNAPVACSRDDYGYQINPPLTDDLNGLGHLIAAHPGALWIVGNEPDRRLAQDDVCPRQYAQAYHDVYTFIKARDVSARVAIAGLVEVTPGRMQYLDIVWDTYLKKYGTSMPVDVWNMHLYILSETGDGDAHIALGTDPALAIRHSFNCNDPTTYCYAEHDSLTLFAEQVVRMRQWMADHGERNKPLILSEYSLLLPYDYPTPENPNGKCSVQTCTGDPNLWKYCFCDENQRTFYPQRVANFMVETFNYLLTAADASLGYPQDSNRLVQQWLWFSLETSLAGSASNLVNSTVNPFQLTVPGQTWNGYVAAIAPQINLLPTSVPAVVKNASDGTSPVTVTLSADIRNNGNRQLSTPVLVTFYSDAALMSPLGSVALNELGGCGTFQQTVSVAWSNVPTGAHYFWVEVDSEKSINESSESDNVMQGLVLVNAQKLYMPLVVRGSK